MMNQHESSCAWTFHMMKTEEISKEANILHDINKASDAIRRKHKMIKSQRYALGEKMDEVLKPITTPLKKLVARAKSPMSPIHSFPKADSSDVSSYRLSSPSSSTLHNHDEEVDDKESVVEIIDDDDDDGATSDEERTVDTDNTYTPSVSSSLSSINNSMNGLVNNYLRKFDNARTCRQLDMKYGIRKDQHENCYMIGNAKITFENNMIEVRRLRFGATVGLMELLFMKEPDQNHISDQDYRDYCKILQATDAILINYRPGNRVNTDRGSKYMNIIDPLLQHRYITGSGLPQQMLVRSGRKIEYVYWDHENELVERLRLLLASREAGNSNHDNEIISILEELREAEIIY